MSPETTAALFGALAGAVVGWALGFLGTLWRDKLIEASEREKLAAALLAELRENKLRFSGFIEHVLSLPEGQPLEQLLTRWSGQQYFPVYDSSTHRLGLFALDDGAAIAHAVGQFKDLMEHYGMIHDREARNSDRINVADMARNKEAVDYWTEKVNELHIKDAETLRPFLKQLKEDTDKAIGVLQKYAK